MHGKERAIARPIFHHLGLALKPAMNLDTDQLGTFSGEIPRRGALLEVALRKARLGMRAPGLPLGLAGEGTFGPHPAVPFFRRAWSCWSWSTNNAAWRFTRVSWLRRRTSRITSLRRMAMPDLF